MMNELDTLFGAVGCVLSGFGLLAGILISAKWVLVVMVVGLLMMGGAILHDNHAERKRYQKYQSPVYNYDRW